MEKRVVKISVRDLVEFIMRSGDIDNRYGRMDFDAMQEGSRLHRKIQKGMGSNYHAEVPLSITLDVPGDDGLAITLEGRADGIITGAFDNPAGVSITEQMTFGETGEIVAEEAEVTAEVIIDEIKTTYAQLSAFKEPFKEHSAQARCYAYIYAVQNDIDYIGVQITYCNLKTEDIKRFNEVFEIEKLKEWFWELISEYCKWIRWESEWKKTRDASIKELQFPFEYRPGQRDLAAGVYKTIIRNKKLFIEAPTGVGKTMSTMFPSIKAMGEGHLEKIFYMTAKTIAGTVAEEAYSVLLKQALKFKMVTITAKEKICVLEKPNCNPVACERAKGHFDRVNDAVFDMLTNEEKINRELILRYAEKHCVCPFEMCLDVTTWADCILCDYNYVFDPKVYLKRFFSGGKREYAFLVDEAHNLVERAREMYSATLLRGDFLKVKGLVKDRSPKLASAISSCSAELLRYKQECSEFEVWESINSLIHKLMQLVSRYEEVLEEGIPFEDKDTVIKLYFDVKFFITIYELLDENYLIYSDYDETGDFRLKLQCLDPSTNLKNCFDKGKSAILFSATLLPINYYKDQLAGTAEDYAVYAPSPFDTKKRLLMLAQDVSTKYTRRNDSEYERIMRYIIDFTSAKKGNYLVFFPSYRMMETIAEGLEGRVDGIILQKSGMTEQEREEFLETFTVETSETHIGFCVMGGIFSEGIDLKEDRLIGVVIVGTGLPMVCNERELFRGFYDERNGCGFEYSYLYPGMNKVLQSAGRVIRTVNDTGAVLLLDERFLTQQYRNLFPREWYPYEVVKVDTMKNVLEEFWKNVN